jgi:hypothetical protein
MDHSIRVLPRAPGPSYIFNRSTEWTWPKSTVNPSPIEPGFQNVWGADRSPKSRKEVNAAVKVSKITRIQSRGDQCVRLPLAGSDPPSHRTGEVVTLFDSSIPVPALLKAATALFLFSIVVESAVPGKGAFLTGTGRVKENKGGLPAVLDTRRDFISKHKA